MTEPVFDNIIPSCIRSSVTQHGVRISPSDALRKLEPGKSFTVDTDQQAWTRARVAELNKGGAAVDAALTVLRIKRRLSGKV